MAVVTMFGCMVLQGVSAAPGVNGSDGTAVPQYVLESWLREYDQLRSQIDNGETHDAAYATTIDPQAMIHPGDRTPTDVVLRRTESLLRNESRADAGDRLQAVDALRKRSSILRKSTAEQQDLFLKACALRRSAMLTDPLLDFDTIVFMPNQNSGSGYPENEAYKFLRKANIPTECRWHDEDYEGHDWSSPHTPCGEYKKKRLGPGPAFLTNFRSGNAEVTSILENSIVSDGRLQGRKLSNNGVFNGIYDLSYDAQRMIFSFAPDTEYVQHLFTVNIDGTDLRQITDGSLQDFEPCFVPGDRIVFASLRRWITQRHHHGDPGSHMAIATLFSMKEDGTDMFPISWHETSELFPSIDNEGMLVYTRWDQIDRNYGSAHHLWRSYPDGADPRCWHGNYPEPHITMDGGDLCDGRGSRPWAEYHFRAIPGTTDKYVAIAGAHHDPLPGVPVIIDISIPDDNATAQVTNVTGACYRTEAVDPACDNRPVCDTALPADFATPWPLSEDLFLVVRTGRDEEGIYLIDTQGNMEIIYRGDAYSPRPLKPRNKPPVHNKTFQGERSSLPGHKRATIRVRNIYEADMPWPRGTRIEAIRVLQVVPKPWSRPVRDDPVTGKGSNCPVRHVLGTAPVEEDGSAFFEAPVGREIYFQALDSNGMAIQSMRSGTYVHPGEHLECIGCHADKWKDHSSPAATPAAYVRPPSPLAPDVSGTCPLNYHILVKPTLENTCIPCHEEKNAGGPRESEYNRVGGTFYFSAGNSHSVLQKTGGHRTIPGRFGAHESRMGKALLENHRDRITEEEFHRMVVWLDANSMELGAYRDSALQKQGKVVWPLIDSDSTNPTGIEKNYAAPVSAEGITNIGRSLYVHAPVQVGPTVGVRGSTIEVRGKGIRKIVLVDARGRQRTMRDQIAAPENTGSSLHTIAGSTPGVYLVRVTSGTRTVAKKVVLPH